MPTTLIIGHLLSVLSFLFKKLSNNSANLSLAFNLLLSHFVVYVPLAREQE